MSKKTIFKKVVRCSILALSLLGVVSCQVTAQADTNTETSVRKPPKYEEFIGSGDTLPLQAINDVSGKHVNLSNNNKRKLVILFATWCSDSNRLLKALNKSAILQDDSIEIIAIAREEDQEIVTQWRDKHYIIVPLASDEDRAIYKQFASAGIPRIITVGKDNKIIKMNLAEGHDQLQLIQWHK